MVSSIIERNKFVCGVQCTQENLNEFQVDAEFELPRGKKYASAGQAIAWWDKQNALENDEIKNIVEWTGIVRTREPMRTQIIGTC